MVSSKFLALKKTLLAKVLLLLKFGRVWMSLRKWTFIYVYWVITCRFPLAAPDAHGQFGNCGVCPTLCDISYDVTFGRKFGLSNGRHLSKSVLDPLAVDKSFSASKFCCQIESNFLNFFIYFVNVQKL
jgi:hypothetical protein